MVYGLPEEEMQVEVAADFLVYSGVFTLLLLLYCIVLDGTGM